ncbi:MAG TPA: hypothetical protein VD908_15875 [Cytophagales bacterium]|nr:hypothetical protein [Cytophagales bacterium]
MDEPDDDNDSKKHFSLPVFKKAEEILKIVQTLSEVIDKEKDVLLMGEQMLANAYVLPVKIVGAESGDLYSIRYDNATLIKLAARELQAQTSLLKEEKLCDKKYTELLRNEIEEFRILFIDWVKGFDKLNDIEDEWDIKGL